MFETSSSRHALAVALLHAAVALAYWFVLGVTIVHDFDVDTWGWFYQNIPTALLLERPLESIWHMHAQPPLWNALGAVLIQVFGSFHMQALQLLHIAFGSATAAMALLTVARLTGSRSWALVAGLVVALHPALFLYEAYALYTTSVALLVTLGAFVLSRSGGRPDARAAVGAFVILAALTLTRSVYHVVLLVCALPFVLALTGRPRRRQMLILGVALLLPFGWYAKNRAQHGFFGASGWYGMGLWRAALFRQPQDVLQELTEAGVLSPVVKLEAFSPPAAYRPLGFDRDSDIPALALNDHHNVNVPDYSAEYHEAAIALIRRSPGPYLRNVLTAYGNFSAPSTMFAHLEDNRDRIRVHAAAEQWLLLRPLVARLEARLGEGYYGSIYYLAFPAVLFLYLFQLTRNLGGARGLAGRLLDDMTGVYLAGLVVYTILISCALELGENVRFKVMVEPAFIILATVVLHRAFATAPEPTGTDLVAEVAPGE